LKIEAGIVFHIRVLFRIILPYVNMTIGIKRDVTIPFVIELYDCNGIRSNFISIHVYIVNSRTYFKCKICNRYRTSFCYKSWELRRKRVPKLTQCGYINSHFSEFFVHYAIWVSSGFSD